MAEKPWGELTAKHFPESNKWGIVLNEMETIADVRSGLGMEPERLKAYALLFAASPSLLEACENLIIALALQPHVSEQPDWLREMMKPVRAAVAKVEWD